MNLKYSVKEGFIVESNIRRKPYKQSHNRFWSGFPVVSFPLKSTIYQLVTKFQRDFLLQKKQRLEH
jgi:hypothetical protein